MSFFIVNNTDKEINYNPRSLKNEILKILSNTEFIKQELIIEKTITDKFYINGKFYKIISNDIVSGYLYIGRVNSCRANGCSVNRGNNNADDFEFFDYYIIFDISKKVKTVKVFNYEATHGQEITSNGWLKQFIGYDEESELVVGKNIDAISGATISVHGIVNDIQEKTSILKNYL